MKAYFILILSSLFFVQAQTTFHTFDINGEIREYYLHLPNNIEDDAPLVFVLHGYSGTANSLMNWTGMNQVANANGFSVCYPQGITDDWNNNFWNVGYEFHANETVDDVEFLSTLAQFLQGEYNLSSQYTFSTGMSNGGDMSYLLACQASDVFKAVAPVAGCMMAWIFTACMPADPIPVFKIHGTADDITYWAGDINNNQGWGPYYDVLTTFNFWVQLNNCTESIVDTLPNTNTSDGSYVVAHKHWNDNNNQVWLYEVVNGGHDWPGDWGNMDINASEEIWNFFTLVVEDSSNIHIENEGQHPTAFALLQNYPNPFNPVTTIRYDLPQESHVHLVIYDILGKEVKTIVNSKELAGYRSVRWDGLNSYGQEVSTGMYFYRLETSDFSKVQKMVLLK